MSIESPTTYGEWYWGKALDKDIARSEQYEKTLAPALSAIVNNIPLLEELPDYLSTFLHEISTPVSAEWGEAIWNTLAGVSNAVMHKVVGNEFKNYDYAVNAVKQTTRITPGVANVLFLRKKIDDTLWLSRTNAGDFSEEEGKFVYESQKPWPGIPDVITYARYHGEPDDPQTLARTFYDISDMDWPLWEWLSRQKLNTEQVQSLFRRETWNEDRCIKELAQLGWRGDDRTNIFELAFDVPNSMLLTQGGLLQELTPDKIKENIRKGGIHADYSDLYLDAILTKPPTTDIIAYELRRDPSLTNIGKELGKIGIHSNYHDLYKELAYQIPPVADIITMAVREAFTPEIAARFGQYQDLPPDFVTWVGKKGLSEEWATRYWAAHWSLPSPLQGFEMLHRGVINRDELSLLLRALDIMPFWREKLIQISYNPFTRIDIRRMYNLGVLSRSQVKTAYKDIGYDDTKAEQMTVFTEKLRERAEERLEQQKERAAEAEIRTWTTAQTLGFLKKGLITSERAIQEFVALGYDGEHINIYLESVKPAS